MRSASGDAGRRGVQPRDQSQPVAREFDLGMRSALTRRCEIMVRVAARARGEPSWGGLGPPLLVQTPMQSDPIPSNGGPRPTLRVSTLPMQCRRRLRQSRSGKSGQQARAKSTSLLSIRCIPHHRPDLATEPIPEVIFRRRASPHSGNVTRNLIGHRANVVSQPKGSYSVGVVAAHGLHAPILLSTPLEGHARAGVE